MTEHNRVPLTKTQPYAGPERRLWDRTLARRRVVGYAQIKPALGRRTALLPGQLYSVLERRPGAVLALEDGLPRPGFVWIEINGKVQESWAAFLDVGPGG
jgi:hypothetical protein